MLAADDMVLNSAAAPAAPAVTAGMPVAGSGRGSNTAVVAAVWRKLLTLPAEQRIASGLKAVRDDILNDRRARRRC